MGNRTMEQKRIKMRRYRMKGAKKVFPSHYNNMVKVSQGPDVRISDYFARAKGLANDHFKDRSPQPEVQVTETELQKELKRVFQSQEGRLQKIHEYYHVQLAETRRFQCHYYFGGGEHFFVQELPSQGIRRVSVVFSSKEEALRNLELYGRWNYFWEQTQKVIPTD